jgi:hypothetical protein
MRLRRIGYWTAGPGDMRGLPDPEDFVDHGWDDDDRYVVQAYLQCGTYFRRYRGFSPCRICGKSNGSGELTDGVLAWPEGLAHYVSEHHVRLPQVIEAHILRQAARIEGAVVDDTWWAAGAPDPASVGDPLLEASEQCRSPLTAGPAECVCQ